MHMRRAPSNERLDASRGATRRAVAARTTAPKRGGVLVRLLPDKPTAAAGLGLLAAACLLLLRMPAPAPQLRPYAPGPPTAALAPPGECALDASWRPLPLAARRWGSADAVLLRFGLDAGESLRLPTCACLLARAGGVVRPYTPVSTNALVGSFELLVKVYAGAGLSARLAELPVGATVDFSHVPKNVKVQFPFGAAHLAMIAGGSGVTPMLQALHAVLGSPGDETAVTVLASHKTREDALAVEALDAWADAHPRLTVVTTLTREPAGSAWAGRRGRVDARLVSEYVAPPHADVKVFVCGPPGMYEALAGPRDDPALAGLLRDLGYAADQVVKF